MYAGRDARSHARKENGDSFRTRPGYRRRPGCRRQEGANIVIIDVPTNSITDAFVLAAAPNERQVLAIVDAIEERLLELPEKAKPVRREGERGGRWVLLDYVDIVVHVQHTEEREFYALDRLWKDCPTIPFVDRDLVEAESAAAE
jgi:ribosome-associated protein